MNEGGDIEPLLQRSIPLPRVVSDYDRYTVFLDSYSSITSNSFSEPRSCISAENLSRSCFRSWRWRVRLRTSDFSIFGAESTGDNPDQLSSFLTALDERRCGPPAAGQIEAACLVLERYPQAAFDPRTAIRIDAATGSVQLLADGPWLHALL